MLLVSVASDPSPLGLLPPDVVWKGSVGDFSPATPGGLAASDPIRTAIVLLLFTHARCEPGDLRFEHNGDRRGWVGDSFGVVQPAVEQPLGSTLWLLRRSKLDESVALRAEAECVRALQPLIRQKVAASVTARARIGGARDRLEIEIEVRSRDGRPIFADRFDLLWQQVT